MNIGQVLEVHLGLAARKLGWKVMTPVFDGATEKDISECLKMAGIYRDYRPGDDVRGKEVLKVVENEDGTKTFIAVSDSVKKLDAKRFADEAELDAFKAEVEASKALIARAYDLGAEDCAKLSATMEKLCESVDYTQTKIVDGKTVVYDGRTGDAFDNPCR